MADETTHEAEQEKALDEVTEPSADDLEKMDPWERLTRPFPLDQVELLPRYTGPKNAAGKPANPKESCKICGGYHAFPAVHLSYVGHAGITMRLNEIGPEKWSWEPKALDENGLPRLTQLQGGWGIWIELTVLGKTVLGFGDAGQNSSLTGNAMKELIGDALRNAAMRLGIGTYLWSKSEAAKEILVRAGADETEPTGKTYGSGEASSGTLSDNQYDYIRNLIDELEYRGSAVLAIAQKIFTVTDDQKRLAKSDFRSFLKTLSGGRTGDASKLIEALKARKAQAEKEAEEQSKPAPEGPPLDEEIAF